MSRTIAHFFGPQSAMKTTAEKARPCDIYHADDGTDYVLDTNHHWFAVGSSFVPQAEPAPAPAEAEPEVSEELVATSEETPESVPAEEPVPEKPKKATRKKKAE